MSSLSTLPKGDSAWLLRKSIQRIMQQVSVLETNIGSSTTGNSADTQVIFNDAGTLRGDTGLTYDKSADRLSFGAGICYGLLTSASATITGDLTVDTSTLVVESSTNRVRIAKATAANYPLDVAGRISYSGAIGEGADTTLSSSGTSLLFGNSATWAQQVFYIAGSEAMRLNATGLGVGVSPAYKLDVSSSSNIVGRFASSNTGNTGVNIVNNSGTTWSLYNFGSADANPGSFGIYHQSGTNFLQISPSGNVGIGVTPSAKLDVRGPNNGNQAIFTGTVNRGLVISTRSDSLADDRTVIFNAAYAVGSLGQFAFQIAGTDRMVLDASGNLLVGVTSGGTARLDIRTSASQRIINAFSTAAGDSSTYGVYIAKFANDSTTAQRFIGFTINNDGAGSGQINANGASQAAFGTFSDSRLKENIVSLPSQLANILSLRPVEFDYKDGSGHQIGFVAQEVQDVYSDAVSEQDGFLTVTGWSKTEARLVSAIKELAAKVQALEAKLA